MCVYGIGFQFHTPGTKKNILSKNNLFGKNHFLTKYRKFLEFSKYKDTAYDTVYENISTVLCTSEGDRWQK